MYCHHCERELRLTDMKCPSCHQSAMSWLHIILISAFGVTVVFYLLHLL
jgi:RNA polymerase subunit RPABC4/transcription elongation factor Spt4